MKKLLFSAMLVWVCCSVAVLSGCGRLGKTGDDVVNTDTIDSDSLEYEYDDDIVSQTPMPKAADELFDDFIYNFAVNRKLQYERINFPLPETTSRGTRKINREAWRMENFYMRQEFYTQIFDNYKQMEAVKDTSINHVVVEKIYLAEKYVRQYEFNRLSGEWRMTSVKNTGFSGSSNTDFIKFYTEFATDSTFQMQSIEDPLEFSCPDPEDDFSTIEGTLLPEQWPSFAPELPREMIYNIVYGEPGKGSSQKIFAIKGIANGLETELTFKKKDGKWMLVKLVV